MAAGFKIPRSVLVVIHTPALDVLLMQRADDPGFWQSVTGSLASPDETHEAAALREVAEETGIHAAASGLRDWRIENEYEIHPQWRHRYAPGVTHNVERVFGLCVPAHVPVHLSAREHLAWRWLPWQEAALACSSRTNMEAIRLLPKLAQ